MYKCGEFLHTLMDDGNWKSPIVWHLKKNFKCIFAQLLEVAVLGILHQLKNIIEKQVFLLEELWWRSKLDSPSPQGFKVQHPLDRISHLIDLRTHRQIVSWHLKCKIGRQKWLKVDRYASQKGSRAVLSVKWKTGPVGKSPNRENFIFSDKTWKLVDTRHVSWLEWYLIRHTRNSRKLINLNYTDLTNLT